MKKFLYTLFYFPFYLCGQNLVPNPSFEQYDTCPNNYGGNNLSTGWFPFRPSPDYFNSCATNPNLGIPSNAIGFQYAATGQAYAGLITYSSNQNEFIGIELTNPLIIGTKYYISFKVCLAEASPCATNNMGVLFSTIPYCYHVNTVNQVCDSLPPAPILNFAHIFMNQIISDTANWKIISGSFVADSSYKYFVIGNFFDQSNTSYNLLYGNSNCGSFFTYYFIDDVCVSSDSTECELFINVHEYKMESLINIYPNPAYYKQINIDISKKNFNEFLLKIIDSYGNEKYSYQNLREQFTLDLKDFSSGIYCMLFSINNEIVTKKLIINH